MYYLFFKPETKQYIQLTFNDTIVTSHTTWCDYIPSSLKEIDLTASWSNKDEWLSPNFKYQLIAISNTLITDDIIKTHFPEVLI